jgi:hypothetical protein
MRLINTNLGILLFSLSFVQASGMDDLFPKSDVYGRSVPQPIIVEGVKYTTPALQGIQRNHLVLTDIINIINKDSKTHKVIHEDGIYLTLRKSPDGSGFEVSSVWKD